MPERRASPGPPHARRGRSPFPCTPLRYRLCAYAIWAQRSFLGFFWARLTRIACFLTSRPFVGIIGRTAMPHRSIDVIALTALSISIGGAQASDDAKYPDWS